MDDTVAGMPRQALVFGEFVLDVANARLTRQGRQLALSRKPFALLAELAARPGELVTKDHLLDTVWQRRFVSDSAVKSVLSELRAVLGDEARSPRWIETVAARGYRFIGRVSATTAPVQHNPPATLGNLPMPPTAVLGRAADEARLLAQLRGERAGGASRLLTLCGPAGVGKSLLALVLAAARASDRRDGAWLVDFGACSAGTDGAAVRGLLTHALNLADAAARDDASLVRSLQGLQLLLVLDNVEAALEALSPLLAQLLAQLPGLQVLATSREPMHLPTEQVHRLSPLGLPDEDERDPGRCMAAGAAQLFVARIQGRLPDFALTPAQVPALVSLCRALDGLPLAMELAAARVPAFGIDGLARQLALAEATPKLDSSPAGLRLLEPSPRRGALKVRHRTLREALDWSHVLLGEAEQRVLRRLSVFCGAFSLESAECVAVDDTLDRWAALDAIDALIDSSWVAASAGEPRRLWLLHGVRAYARQRLHDAGESSALRRRHFDAVLLHWQGAHRRALGEPALAWVQAHDHTLADLRAALAWACDAVCATPPALPGEALLALVGASGLLWHRAGHAGEGVRWCERALTLTAGSLAPAATGTVDLALAHLAGIAMVLPARQGLQMARRAAGCFALAGDKVHEAYALYLEHTLMARAEPEADRAPVLQRLQGLQQPEWGPMLRRFERAAAAYEARLQGRHAEYLAFNRAELARCRQAGATWEAWSAGIGLMLALHDSGRLAEAVAAGREVIDDIRAAGRLRQNANRLAMWIMMLAESGDTAATRAALAEALPVLQGAWRTGMALLGAAWLAVHEGRPALAACALARFDAPGRTGAEFGPGTFIRRSVATLWARLHAQLDAAAQAEACARAEAEGDLALLQEVLQPIEDPPLGDQR